MCGICGTIGLFKKEEREAIVNRMNEAIIHRGPDESGWFSDEVCTLAMRRLSIIDIEQGSQPKYNNRKNRLIFFNGEIYNFRELRESLINKGYLFTSHSDTEVIINLYDEYGENMFTLLKGMFAFCIYDKETTQFLFARDRFGEKPLYYYPKGEGLVFSSEVKSLLENPAVKRNIDKKSLAYYLKVTFVPEPYTLLKDVYSLPAGSYMKFLKGQLIVKKYFEADYTINSGIQTIAEAASLVKPIFEQAVRRQMISDVPLGAFLSGGVDSSSVVAQMQMLSSKPIQTFNVKFEEAAYDESPIAREVASRLGTQHHELVIPNAEFDEEIFWKIIDHVGFPFPDSSAIPTWFITHEIKKHVTVALSGDGGDELFGGYPVFDWYKKIRRFGKVVPTGITKASAKVLQGMKKMSILHSISAIRQLEKGFTLSQWNEKELPIEIHSMFDNEMIYEMTGIKSTYDIMQEYPSSYDQWSDIRKMMNYRIKYNLPLDMLIKVDRMSMSNSLEVRAPFLDADLFEISATLPDAFLRKNKVGKLVVREIMKDILPASVFSHPKSGFSIPLHKYQNGKFEKLVEELFNEKSTFTSLFDKEFLMSIKEKGLQNKKDNSETSVYKSSHQLWSLLQLAGWMKKFKIGME